MEPKVYGVRNDYGFNPPPYYAGFGSARPHQIGYEVSDLGGDGISLGRKPKTERGVVSAIFLIRYGEILPKSG